MDRTGGYYAEGSKSIGEGQTLYGLTHSGNIKKIVKGIIGERRENEWEISERVTEHERLLTLGNELGVVEREEVGEWVMGTEGGT